MYWGIRGNLYRRVERGERLAKDEVLPQGRPQTVAPGWELEGEELYLMRGSSFAPASGLAVQVCEVAVAQVVTQPLHHRRSEVEPLRHVRYLVLTGQVVDELL
jgi:hypothetical protein